ncbi:squalene synthase HpnC [Asanoa sp. WMMD1127]|uniref:squalene synthase HpnC n=1 Tax=Asanoa sp. WMMD1127 TaxID=3016107 RepID=UPI002417E897|nr:squalene synthase HpnC [Asanoa sp. WMMD1127]MDG4827489.1 squalene synthase HpnC [Asanoa sp. WMMD1127]
MTSLPDPAGAGDAYLRAKEQAENFPVALRILPRRHREHLLAVYDVARVIDDLGDRGHGDRRPALHAFDQDIDELFGGGEPRHPVLRGLRPTVVACGLDARPFHDLVAANLLDQEKAAYGTFDELVGYCRLSADPVGRIVLRVFGADDPRLAELSDRICTALQIVEHCQDVAEDRRNGRIYLPLEDLDQFGVRPTDLDAPRADPSVRRLVRFEAERAGALLDQGLPLLRRLRGWGRLAVTGYVAGGRATLYALRRADWDVLARTPRPKKRDILAQAVAATLGQGVMSR